jgi:hypothetical protein
MVHVDLAVQAMRKKLHWLIAVPMHQGYASFVAGGFNTQDMHMTSVAMGSRAAATVRIATPQANRHN